MLRRFLSGDASACRAVERWAREILLYQRLGLTREEREDIVQEVLGGVWQAAGRPGFALRRGLRAFVRTVTLARAIDRVRRRRRSVPVEDTLRDPSPGPETDAESSAEAGRLHEALGALDPRCREIIRLHYFEDLPYARIAALQRRSEATMRVRMFHCLRVLRERLGAAPGPGAA
jgi:RNA polymerase sigma-70 factor (ECF subfamily)